MAPIGLRIFDQSVQIETDDPRVIAVVHTCYSTFFDDTSVADSDALRIAIESSQDKETWTIQHADVLYECKVLADLVYWLEKSITIELQKLRKDLFFLHAAAIGLNGKCTLILGKSGAGKSTLCWGLCNLECIYLSDELAPVNVDTMEIEPYPHAICLKRIDRVGCPAPPGALVTDVTEHIPVEAIPAVICKQKMPVRNLVFLENRDGMKGNMLTEIGKAEAAARIYANGLNQLAHDRDGLVAATRIAVAARCFQMDRHDAGKMSREIRRLLDEG